MNLPRHRDASIHFLRKLKQELRDASGPAADGDEDERSARQEDELVPTGVDAANDVIAIGYERHEGLHQAEERHQAIFFAVPVSDWLVDLISTLRASGLDGPSIKTFIPLFCDTRNMTTSLLC